VTNVSHCSSDSYRQGKNRNELGNAHGKKIDHSPPPVVEKLSGSE